MTSIIEYRTDLAPVNAYPRRIVSPPTPSACCLARMVPLGPGGIDGRWRADGSG